jgi:hypothetical protein
VVSLSTRGSVKTKYPNGLAPQDPEERCYGLMHKFLNNIVDNKVRNLPSNRVPFTTLVFTVGGMMDRRTFETLRHWGGIMPHAATTTLGQQLSLILLKARAKSFVLWVTVSLLVGEGYCGGWFVEDGSRCFMVWRLE